MATHSEFPGVKIPCLNCGSEDACGCAAGLWGFEWVSLRDGLVLDVCVWIDGDGAVDAYVAGQDFDDVLRQLEGVPPDVRYQVLRALGVYP